MLSQLPTEDKLRLRDLIKERSDRIKYNYLKVAANDAYPWQIDLANSTKNHGQLLAMCANQVGKTWAGAWITAIHLTGRYPEDWKGHRFTKPIKAWACGVSNDTVRDILQAQLLGEPGDESLKGSGFVPLEDIVDCVRKPQVPNAYQSATIKFHGPHGNVIGASKLDFKSYEQGETKFMGRPMDWIWLDEQPDDNIYTQCITRTVATGGITMMTFTPESGMNETIQQFLNDRKQGQYLVRATWEEAPHLSEERKNQLLAQYSPHERKLRSTGVPVFGSGLVFPIPDDDIMCEPFNLPEEWPRLVGMDFGWDHPTAAVWMAWDRETDTVYFYHEYRKEALTAQQHALAIKAPGQWIPVVWPHDGIKHDPGSGLGLATQYRSHGLNMTSDHFRNPPSQQQGGKGDIKIEPGINAMLEAMENGQFKVFSTLVKWFEEKALYHRGDGKIKSQQAGKIQPKTDDLMSATRYAFQCRNRAKTRAESSISSKYQGRPLPVNNIGVV